MTRLDMPSWSLKFRHGHSENIHPGNLHDGLAHSAVSRPHVGYMFGKQIHVRNGITQVYRITLLHSLSSEYIRVMFRLCDTVLAEDMTVQVFRRRIVSLFGCGNGEV